MPAEAPYGLNLFLATVVPADGKGRGAHEAARQDP